MNDWVYLLMYLVGFAAIGRNLIFVLSMTPFVLVMIMPDTMFAGYGVSFAYCAISCLYLVFSVAAIRIATKPISLSLAVMAVYCFYFAIDGWVNSNVQTWVFVNHEIIIAVLHLFIILSNSKRLTSMVGDTANTCLHWLRGLSSRCATHYRLPWRKSQKGTE